MDSSNNDAKAPPPPVPPSRRSTVIINASTGQDKPDRKALAPSPPPKPSSLQSPLPPRKPISLSAAAIATVAANSFSATPPIPAPRPHTHAHAPAHATSPSAAHHPDHGFVSAPVSASNSPATTHSASFAPAAASTAQSASSSPAPAHSTFIRSQTIPVSPSHLRSAGSSSFLPAAASWSIAARQQLLQQQQQQHHSSRNHDEPEIDEEPAANPFSDPCHTPAAPPVASSPSFVQRTHNQSSLLTARLQATPSPPSLHAPVPQYGSHAHIPSPRANVASPPPPPSSLPSLPPRSRSPLAALASATQQSTTPTPARHNAFTATQRHSSVQPIPPPYPPHSLAMSSPSQPAPPPPRRATASASGPSPMHASVGESGMAANAARFRNLTAPQQTYEHLSPQPPKRVFSTSSSSTAAASTLPSNMSYARPTSPVPERGLANMELSDSQTDSDATSEDSDKEYEEEDYAASATANPFATFVDASPRPTRTRSMMEPPPPPSLPSRPALKPPPARQPNTLSDQDVAPALPPKPSIRRRPQPQQDPGSLLSLGQAMESEGDLGRNSHSTHLQPSQPTGPGPSPTDGVFPDYSRSNRRLPLFSDVIEIHDIQQKSHDTKPTALLFAQSRRPESLGQYLWAGWSEGSLQVIDTRTKEVVEKKRASHKGGCVTNIIRSRGQVWTVDDTGSVFVWPEDPMLGRPTIQTPLQSLTIPPKQICAIAVQDQLWSSDGAKIHVIRVGPDAGRPKLTPTSMDIPFGIGPLTCLATIAGSGQVFSGHEDGKVILWSIETREKIRIINVHAYRIMSLLGVGSYLWAGFATGKIYVLDLRPEVPVVMKDWQAHKDSGVAMLQLDEEGLILGSRHQVGSCAENGEIKIWDGLMAKDRLTKGMIDRSKEYCQWRDIKILICSWNIDASKPKAQDVNGGADRRMFESWLTSMDQEGPPDIISVGFQEIVDLESKKMTAKSLLKGSKRAETETISKQYKRWQLYLTAKIRELYAPMGVNFRLLECSNLVGLFSCVFVRDQEWENVRSEWTHVDMVKTGLKGYHGNKGGIATRLIIDDSSISFVNCHLAAGQSHTRQRNIDAANVLKKLTHPNPAISNGTIHPEVFWFGDGTMAMDHEVCFLSGDLNYRIDVKFSEAVSRVQAQDWAYLHQYDQLLQQRLKNPQFALRAFNECELRFAPTYKYDPGTDTYDTSSKHRTPAWCDRILWRGRHVRQLFYKRCECRVSDHKPISGGFVVSVKRIDEAQRRVVEQQVKEGWFKVQEKEIRIKKLAWLRSWGWNDPRVEGILDREGGNLEQVVRLLSLD
ncbi:unnamed protein product [Mortierella alpina]